VGLERLPEQVGDGQVHLQQQQRPSGAGRHETAASGVCRRFKAQAQMCAGVSAVPAQRGCVYAYGTVGEPR
jgi:hypothetical protein